MARRQELARSGQLPRAQVVYLSPEEKAAGSAPIPELPAEPVSDLPVEPVADLPTTEQPAPGISADEPDAGEAGVAASGETAARVEAPSPQTVMRETTPDEPPLVAPSTPQKAAETAPEMPDRTAEVRQPAEAAPSAIQRQPEAVQAPADTPPADDPPGESQLETTAEITGQAAQASLDPVARSSEAAPEAMPAEAAQPATTSDTPNVGRRLLRAARSLLRRVDEDEKPAAAEPVADELADAAQATDGEQPRAATVEPAKGIPPLQRAPATSPPPTETRAVTPAAATPAAEIEAETGPTTIIEQTSPAPQIARLPETSQAEQLAEEPAHATQDIDGPEPLAEAPARSQPEAADPVADEPVLMDEDQDSVETVIAPVPLQQVWQVEEKPPPPSRPSPEAKAAQPAVQRKSAGGDSVGEEVHSALREVAPGKGTDSSIELVTPRRPRPVVPPAPIERQVDDQPPDERPPAPPPVDHLPAADPGQQRPAQPAPTASEPHLVPTEIGDLPSDLWSLLGERPPSPSAGSPVMPTAPATAQRSADVATAVSAPALAGAPALAQMAAEAAPETARQRRDGDTAGAVTQYFAPPAIQRIDSEQAAGAGEAAGDPEETVAEQAPEGDEGPDIDELARKVLPEIKRRLAIDWERGRGRIR
jgi:hypothetical protein